MQQSLDYPLFIWESILPNISIKDIITLRSVNKDLYLTLGTNEIWKPIVINNWFNDDYRDDWFLDFQYDIDDFAKYYRNRKRIDISIVKKLKEISRFNNDDDLITILKECWKLSKLSYRALPILYKIITNDNKFEIYLEIDDEYYLTIKYFAGLIYSIIRKGQFFQSLTKYYADADADNNNKQESIDTQDLEQFYLEMSKLDPSYPYLIKYRNKSIKEIISKVLNDSNYHHTKPSTFKISLIIKAFNKVIIPSNLFGQNQFEMEFDNRFEPNFENCTENYSILRIYSGEISNSNNFLKLAIIQKIAKFFNIKTYLTQLFLIIKDESFNTGESYLSLTSQNGFKIYTYNYILNRMGQTRIHDSLLMVEKLIKPLDFVTIRGKYLLDLQNSNSISFKTNKQLGSLSYSNLYPKSFSEFGKHEDFKYLECCINLIEMSKFGNFDNRNNNSIHFCKKFISSFDLINFTSLYKENEILKSINPIDLSKELDFNHQSISGIIQKDLIGSIMIRISRNYKSYYILRSIDPIKNHIKTIPNLQNNRLTLQDFHILSSNEITQQILDILMKIENLGKWFKKFDYIEKKFIPK
ncbi:hypothetical protein WICMUC_000057 [Wickerhamomyces mucosus]|uniref:F-box domain-containing protein n=1 Tax=Wickerhamomyces mucosus TaxID=1378264 RepID=A0A9P8TJA7_9ASCO|nr:hypothetical protein WICMUC_000057 [Wickerhamomyces mucosus]